MSEYRQMEQKIFVWEIEGISKGIVFAESMAEARHKIAAGLPEMYMNEEEFKVCVYILEDWQRKDELKIFAEEEDIYVI